MCNITSKVFEMVKKIVIKSVSIDNEKATATVEVDGQTIEYVKIEKVYFSTYFNYFPLE